MPGSLQGQHPTEFGSSSRYSTGSIEIYTIFPIIKGKNSFPPTLNVPFILRGK